MWVIGSVLVYVAAAYGWWRWHESADRLSAGWQRWRQRIGSPAVSVPLRALYYVGVPYAAMLLGAADFPIYLGLARLDWPSSIGRGALAGAALFLGLVAIAAYSLRGPHRLRAGAETDDSRGVTVVYEALFLEAHWAFYRLPGILATGDLLLGAWIGATLAVVEQVADPHWRSRAASKQWALAAWQRLALLAGMTAVFLLTRNFWVAWAVHTLVEWGRAAATRHLLRGPVARSVAE